jgi:hypothetical protein
VEISVGRSSLRAVVIAVVAASAALTSGASTLSCTNAPSDLVIVHPIAAPMTMTTDGTSLYWMDTAHNGLWSAPSAGGMPTQLYESEVDGVIGLDAMNVYFMSFTGDGTSDEPALFKIPKSGGSASLVPGVPIGDLGGALVHKGVLYWASSTPGSVGGWPSIQSMPLTGGTVTTLASNLHVLFEFMEVTDASVFLINRDGGTVSVFPIAGLPMGQAPKSTGFGSTRLEQGATDDTTLYVTTGDSSIFTITDDLTVGTIDVGHQAIRIGVDGDNLYFMGTEAGVFRIPKTGGTATQITHDANPRALAIDSSFLYVSDDQRLIYRAPK